MASTETAVMERRETRLAKGVWAPVVTPFNADLSPDAGRLIAHTRWLLDNGCHGVGLFGTTGEGTSLSADERIALLEAVLADGVPADRLMVGTGCAALSDTLRLTKACVKLGCPDVLMLPPFYYKDVSDEGLFASYAAVIEGVGDGALGIYLYHFPKLSCVPIPFAVIERLIEAFPGAIRGVKDSSGDGEHTLALVDRFPQLSIFAGMEPLLLAVMERGGAGCITAGANVNAPAIRRVYDAHQAGDSVAASLQEQVTAQRKALQTAPMIPGLKHILAEAQGDPAWSRVRPPLVALSEAAAGDLRAALDAADFAFGEG